MKTESKKRTLVLLLALVMVSSISALNIVKADSLQITTSNTYLVAGQENELRVNIKNIGDRSVVGIQAILSSTTPGINIIEGSQKAYTVIEDGENKNYPVTVYVDKSLPLGSYTLTLTVTYQKISFEYVTSTVSVGVIVSDGYSPNLGLKINPDGITATAGAENQISYMFRNTSNMTLTDLEFNLESTSPFINIIEGNLKTQAILQDNQTLSLRPTVSVLDGTPLSLYSLQATISFMNEDDNSYFETYNLPVNVNTAKVSRTTTLTINDIEISPESIKPGDRFTLGLDVECSGADAYDLMSTITFQQNSPISTLGPSTINLGDLEQGTSTGIEYELLISGAASAGQYTGTITVSYTGNRGNPKMLTETITILVDGLIEFRLLDTPSLVVSAGGTHEFESDLLLIGTESVDFVSMGIVEDNIIQHVSGSDEYIGAVDPDSPIPFDVLYKVDPDAPEVDHDLRLNVKYRDHLNREHEEEIQVEIEIGKPVEENPQKEERGFWIQIRKLLGWQ